MAHTTQGGRPGSVGGRTVLSPATPEEEQGDRGDVWVERVARATNHGEGDGIGDRKVLPLEASFLIKMPESEATARFRRRVREEEGEEMLHPPMEVAIWSGVLQR